MCSQIRNISIACILSVALGGVFQTAAADIEANKAVIDRWLDLWETADLAIADEIFATDFVSHIPHYPDAADLEGYKEEVARMPTYVPDFDATIEDMIAEGDKVVGRFTATATMQPYNVPYTNTWIIIFRFTGGQIIEEWWEFDLLGVQQQLGVMPPMRETYTWGEPSDVTGDPGDPASNKTIFQRMFDEVAKGNLVVIDELFAADYVMHDPAWPMEVKGPDGFKQWTGAMFEPFFSDSSFTLEDIIAEGDKVTARWLWAGTHTGDFMGIPPTGNQIAITGTSIHRFADGKFVESWASYDGLGMMQQLTMPPEWPIEGAWINLVPIPDLGVIIGELTIVPQDREGLRFTSAIRVGKPEPTVFGAFPDADHQSDHIGPTVWTGSPAYESTFIGYGTKKSELPGMLPEIVYISVLYAKTEFVDRNTLKGEGTHAFFLASQDADGDGLPDEGQEPVACFPYISTAKRVQLMPPCVPPPPPEPEGE